MCVMVLALAIGIMCSLVMVVGRSWKMASVRIWRAFLCLCLRWRGSTTSECAAGIGRGNVGLVKAIMARG